MIGRMLAVGVLLAGLGGCIAVGGTSTNSRPTKGQELIDLKTALDRGAMTKAEYDAAKAQVLNRN